jgi:PAS domain S-box-containing protein
VKPLSISGSGNTTSKAESVRIPRTEEFYRKIYQQVATGIAITDWQGVFQECNPAYCALLGYTEKELRTIDFVSLIHPEDREANLVHFRRLQVGEIPSFEIENRYIHKNGEPVWVRKFVSLLHGEEGEPTHLIALVTNVTERKRAEEAIKESEMRYRRIVETTNEGVWLLDSKLHTSYVNRQMAGMLGYEPGDMVGRSVFDFYFSEDVDHKKQVLTRREQGVREQLEERLRRRDGSELWVRMSATPVIREDCEFDGAFAMVCDITERKRAEEAIKESEQRFRLVADSAPVMIWMSGLDKRTTYFNRPWLDFTGQSEADLQSGLAGIVHPEDYSKCYDIYCRGFDQRQPFAKECRLKRHDGQYRWMLDIGVPRFHEDGSFAGYIGSCVDITEQKLAEEALSSISRRLIDAQEQERGRIARELHDDINQRLALVAMGLDRQRGDLRTTTRGMRSAVGEAIKQISDIVSDVHMMSHRLHSSKLDTVGLAAAAAGFCRELSKQQNVKVDFQCDRIARELPEAIALCMFRVLQEALQNAVRHSGAKHFKVSLAECTNQIALTICDEGRGFNPAEALKGNGLGLASMIERLKLVGGELLIDAGPKRGTTIRASVPFACQAKSAYI